MIKNFTKHFLAALLIVFAGTAVGQTPTITYKSNNQFLVNAQISSLKPKHSDTTMVPYYVTQVDVNSTLTDPINITFDGTFMYISEDGNSDHIRRVDLTNNPISSTIIANTALVSSDIAGATTNAPLGLAMGDFAITVGGKTIKDFYFLAQASKSLYYASPETDGTYTYTKINPASPTAPLNYPHDIIRIPGSNPAAYVISDRGIEAGNRLLKFTPSAGTQFELIDVPSAELWEPASLAFDSNNDLYVVKALKTNKKIIKINITTGAYQTIVDMGAATTFPIAIEGNRLFYRLGNTILVANKDTGEILYNAQSTESNPSLMNRHNFNDPFSIKKNPVDGNLYVASKGHDRIEKINLNNYTISPTLPSGLTLNPITGEISGTPSTNTTVGNYTIALKNALGATVTSQAISIEVVNTLPVTLTSFNAKKQTNGVNITWVTSAESKNNRFELFKSTDGKNFNLISTKPSLGNQGGNYSYIDTKPSSGSNYYKLVQIDNDGTTKELGLQVVKGGLTVANWSVYPNPSNGTSVTVKYNGNNTTQTVKVYDVAGRLVHSQIVTLNGETTLNFNPALAKGIYTLALGTLGVQKLVVE